MRLVQSGETDALLSTWRARVVNIFSIVAVLAASLLLATLILEAATRPGVWPSVVIAGLLTTLFIMMAIFRQIDSRIRAWVVLFSAFAAGVLDLANYGLGGDGRLLLFTLLITGLVLIDIRAGFIMIVLSALAMAVSAFQAYQGLLGGWLLIERSSLLLSDWLVEGFRTLVIFIAMMWMLSQFYRFLLKNIEDLRRTGGELEHAHTLLAEQNRTLEERVLQRTAELEQSAGALQRSARALEQSEQLYRSVVDNSIDTYFRLDGEGNLLLVSPSGARLIGYDSPADLIGLNITRDFFADPCDRDRFIAQILEAGSIQDFEAVIKRRDGSPVVVLANARLYLGPDGTRLGYDGFLRDFTEKKRMRDKEIEYLQQVEVLTAAAGAVEEGQFRAESLNGIAARQDALGQLGRIFQRMAREIYAREQSLKQQVQELRIQIDETKKAHDVAEITESDYFRQLRSNISSLRNILENK